MDAFNAIEKLYNVRHTERTSCRRLLPSNLRQFHGKIEFSPRIEAHGEIPTQTVLHFGCYGWVKRESKVIYKRQFEINVTFGAITYKPGANIQVLGGFVPAAQGGHKSILDLCP